MTDNMPASSPEAAAPGSPAAERARTRNLIIIAAGVFITLGVIGYLIYSEAPRHEPIDITAPYQYLPPDTTSVLYVNGRALLGGVEQFKTTMDASAATATGPAEPAPEITDPDALFAQRGSEAATGLSLLDQIKGLRDVEHILIAGSRSAAVPTLIIAPFRDPEALMNNLQSLPGFSSSRIVEDQASGWRILQLKLAWQKLLYLSAAENKYLFAGDGTYFLKTLRGFQRPMVAASFQGGPVRPLLAPIRPGTILSAVMVISYPDDLEARFEALERQGDESSIALVRSIRELGASLQNLYAVRMDVWRRAGDAALMIEVSLLFSREEFGVVFQRNIDQARSAVVVLAGVLLPRDVGAAFGDLAGALASPQVQGRVVTLTLADSPGRIEAFLQATGTWLERQMTLPAFGKPAASP